MLAVAVMACDKDSTDDDTTQSPDAGLYMSGYAYLGRAVYWNNGREVDLGAAFNTTDIAVSGSDVYVLGNIGFALPAGGTANAAVYWKNGEMVRLGSDPSYANALTVSGKDVYVCGYAMINNLYVAAYWKNGEVHALSDLPHSGANAMLVEGPDVYIAGMAGSNGDLAVYWKNGTMVSLGQGVASGLAMHGADLYVSGTTSAGAVYWKDGVQQILYVPEDTITTRTSTSGIAVSGSDVYVIGYINGIQAALWKNGAMSLLNNPSVAMNLSGNKNRIIIQDTSVYISFNTAEYWKNGRVIHAGNGYASSIALKE